MLAKATSISLRFSLGSFDHLHIMLALRNLWFGTGAPRITLALPLFQLKLGDGSFQVVHLIG